MHVYFNHATSAVGHLDIAIKWRRGYSTARYQGAALRFFRLKDPRGRWACNWLYNNGVDCADWSPGRLCLWLRSIWAQDHAQFQPVDWDGMELAIFAARKADEEKVRLARKDAAEAKLAWENQQKELKRQREEWIAGEPARIEAKKSARIAESLREQQREQQKRQTELDAFWKGDGNGGRELRKLLGERGCSIADFDTLLAEMAGTEEMCRAHSPRTAKVVILRGYGLTLREIGLFIEVSPARVRQILTKAAKHEAFIKRGEENHKWSKVYNHPPIAPPRDLSSPSFGSQVWTAEDQYREIYG